jgi:hypothetical protein
MFYAVGFSSPWLKVIEMTPVIAITFPECILILLSDGFIDGEQQRMRSVCIIEVILLNVYPEAGLRVYGAPGH